MEKVKVLLADDSEHFGKPCAAVMRAYSLEVQVTTKDGRQVLNLIEQMHPDVVFMDFFMLHMDATEVLRSMQGWNLTKSPHVIIMSSFDNPNLEQKAILAGADFYFLKPFDADEMAQRVLSLYGEADISKSIKEESNGTTPVRNDSNIHGGQAMEKAVKVLLADDSEHFGKPFAAVMRAYSLEVQVVTKDGHQVLALIEQMQPDVVFMDFFMPHLDAIGVLRGMQKMNLEKRPQVMIMSSLDNPELEQKALLAGADYYILQPFNADEIAERILTMNGKTRTDSIQRNPVQSTKSSGSLEMRVTEVIHKIGVPSHIKGCQYLRDAILMAINDDDIINNVTKRLYPAVAKKNSTTSSRVEQAIRHAIEVAWDKGDVDVLNSYFDNTIHNGCSKPTNSEFIAMISDRFRLQLGI